MDILNIAKTTALVLAVTQFAACSSGPPPKQELSLTQASIRSAEAADASTHAPKALRTAQQKVEEAEALMAKKKHDKAKRLLTQAMADAELAEATAEAEKSRVAYEELQQSIDLMKEEIARVQD
jgi:Cdc6-like AAA superfamily ATPase